MTASAGLEPVTFEVAGLTSRVTCAYAKPLLWVTELHPGFQSRHEPALAITIQYDDEYWARGLPWIAPDQLIDAPVCTRRGDGTVIETAYYEATITAEGRRAHVRIAGGFGVGGVFRAIYAMLLPRRSACLVRATIRPTGAGSVLTCGDAEDAVIALIDCGDHVEAEPTPFHAGTTPTRPPRRRVDAIAGTGGTRAAVAARLLEDVVVVDHAPETLDQVLDVLTKLTACAPAAADSFGTSDISLAR